MNVLPLIDTKLLVSDESLTMPRLEQITRSRLLHRLMKYNAIVRCRVFHKTYTGRADLIARYAIKRLAVNMRSL
jgi:hypothetical protein